MADKWCELADRNALCEAVRHLNEQDLHYLNRLVVERLKLISQARSTAIMSNFSVGDRVNFESHTGMIKTGVIIRLNKKTASIVTDDGEKWNVHPGYLRPMRDGDIQHNRGR